MMYFLLLLSGLIALSFGQMSDVNDICDPKSISCKCGKNGYPIYIQIKQCVRWYRFQPSCDDCKGEPEEEERCSIYENCLECDADVDRCIECPPGRFGKWCDKVSSSAVDCPTCHNGGVCNKNTKTCVCPEGFQGNECQLRMGCSPPLLIDGATFDQKESYPVGSSVAYRCNEKRVTERSMVTTCLANGQWSNFTFTCIASCPKVMVSPLNGFVYHNGQTQILTYSCKSGYELVGNKTRECGENSIWIGDQPKCVKIITCSLPMHLPDKLIIANSDQKGNFTVGFKLKFACKEGFVAMGKENVVCQKNGSWSSPLPNCVHENFTCPEPKYFRQFLDGKIHVIGESGSSSFKQGTKIVFECDFLYELDGNRNITCGANNTWSGGIPECVQVPACLDFPKIRNGQISKKIISRTNAPKGTSLGRRKLILSLTTRKPKRKTSLNLPLPAGYSPEGTVVTFKCDEFYELKGAFSRSCVFRLGGGEWTGSPPTCVPKCGRSGVPRTRTIINGTPSREGQWPWQVGIARKLKDWFIVCGGSLISETLVVTAAHCVTDNDSHRPLRLNGLQLYFGKYHRNNSMDDKFVQVRQVSEMFIHPNYEPLLYDSDIAIIRLSEAVKLTSRVQPVCLPNKIDAREDIKDGKIGTVIGWGLTERKTEANRLQFAEVPVVSIKRCQEGYKSANQTVMLSKNMLCAGYDSGEMNSCKGDSGGPLVFPTPVSPTEQKWVLEGVVSWNSKNECNQHRQYAGYTRVRRFIDWILDF